MKIESVMTIRWSYGWAKFEYAKKKGGKIMHSNERKQKQEQASIDTPNSTTMFVRSAGMVIGCTIGGGLGLGFWGVVVLGMIGSAIGYGLGSLMSGGNNEE